MTSHENQELELNAFSAASKPPGIRNIFLLHVFFPNLAHKDKRKFPTLKYLTSTGITKITDVQMTLSTIKSFQGPLIFGPPCVL